MTEYPDPEPLNQEEENPWIITGQRAVYDNPWISLTEHDVVNPGGNPGIYGVVHYKHYAIGIIPLQGLDTWLVGQHRFPFNQYSWEIPAGGGHREESPLMAAQRELAEETGLKAREWKVIQRMQLSNSVSDEEAIIFLATGLTAGLSSPTEEEKLQVVKLPLSEAIDRVYSGELTDSMTVAGLLRLDSMIKRGLLRLPV